VFPVLLIWVLYYNRAERRWRKFAAFVTAAVIPCVPLVWLFIEGPRQVFFGVVEYNLKYRRLSWPTATKHNLEVYAAWIDSPQAIILGLLAAAGLLFVVKRREWKHQFRAELYLCAFLAVALGL